MTDKTAFKKTLYRFNHEANILYDRIGTNRQRLSNGFLTVLKQSRM